jgi:1,2-dihydroxy-3-keto-5-methylthiopentene dioxygenase
MKPIPPKRCDYSRFAIDYGSHPIPAFIVVFQDEPKWIAYNRGADTDENPYRKKYLKSLKGQSPVA